MQCSDFGTSCRKMPEGGLIARGIRRRILILSLYGLLLKAVNWAFLIRVLWLRLSAKEKRTPFWRFLAYEARIVAVRPH